MSGGPSELSESVRSQRRGVADTDGIDDSSSDTTAADSAVPDDINAGRRTTSNTQTEPQPSNTPRQRAQQAPADINTGRRNTSTQPTQSQPSSPVNGSTTSQSDGSQQSSGVTAGPPGIQDVLEARAAQRASAQEQLAQQAVESRAGLTDTSQVEVSELERTDDGFQGDVVLTERGVDQLRDFRQETVDQMGTTGRTLQRRQRQARAQRQQDAFEADVATSQFAQRQLARQIEREQGFGENTIDVQPTEDGDISIGLTIGGEARQLIESAEEQGLPSQDIKVVNTDDGLAVEFTDTALRERAARGNRGVSPDDLQVRDKEVFASDARLFREAGEDVPDDTRRVVELTEDARRERLKEKAQAEYPNAEDIEIVEEGGALQAEITPESGQSRAIRMGEQFVDDPVGSTVEGSEDIVRGTASGIVTLAEGGAQGSADLVTDPVGTTASVGEDLAGGTDDYIVDPTIDFGSDVVDKTKAVAGSDEAKAVTAGAVPIAAAEPTPLGEITLGTAAGITVGGIGAAVAIDRGADALDSDPFVGATEGSGEMPVGRPRQDVSELGVGEPNQSEVSVVDPTPVSEVEVGQTVMESEVDVPEEKTTSEVEVPGIETQQLVGEQQESDVEEEGVEENGDELGVPEDPFRESDRRLFDPTRTFGEQESDVSEVDPTDPSRVSEEDIGSGIAGEGQSMFEEPEVSEDELIGGSVSGGPEFRDVQEETQSELRQMVRERESSASVIAGLLGVELESDARARRAMAQRGLLDQEAEQSGSMTGEASVQDVPQAFPVPVSQDSEAEQESVADLELDAQAVEQPSLSRSIGTQQEALDELVEQESAVDETLAQQMPVQNVNSNINIQDVVDENIRVNQNVTVPQETVRFRGKPRLRFDLDFDSSDPEKKKRDRREFERVFTSNVASPDEILGLSEDQ